MEVLFLIASNLLIKGEAKSLLESEENGNGIKSLRPSRSHLESHHRNHLEYRKVSWKGKYD